MRDRRDLEVIGRDLRIALARLDCCHDEYEPLRKLLVKAETVVDEILNPKVSSRAREE